jgi:hypothetical protein
VEDSSRNYQTNQIVVSVMPVGKCAHLRLVDFSEFPGGRFVENGPFSGEEYRKTVLLPALESCEIVEIDFAGVFVAAPSFLDEAFGEIVKRLGPAEFRRRIQVRSDEDPDIFKQIERIVKAHK